MDASLIAAAVLVALIAAAVVLTARLVRLDRPASPPTSIAGDWRDDAMSWRHLGIR